MNIRRIVPTLTCLLSAAAPALAQEASDKSPQAEEPVQAPAATPTPAEPAAPAAPKGGASATGTVNPGAAGATSKPRAAAGSLAANPSQRGQETTKGSSEWKTDFHGYFRAPLRVGMGKRPTPPPPQSPVGDGKQTQSERNGDKAPGESNTTFHVPVVPDDQYLSWQSTAHQKRDWAEMFFGIGNSWAKATIGIQGYNFTDASYSEPQAQYGIGQAYVTLTPDLGYENVRLALQVGAFQGKYGSAGKYDAGEYDTYLFGRTHAMGETLHVDFDINESWTLWFEHGIGGKRPDPVSSNNARFTLINHAHVGLVNGNDMQFTAHYLHSWAQEEDRPYDVSKPDTFYASSAVDVGDGKLWVAGVDARFDLGAFGYFYGGFSHIGAKNAIIVGRALEVLHASGGGEFSLGVTDNYFGPGCRSNPIGISDADNYNERVAPFTTNCSMGTGSVNSLLAQYEFSLTNFLQMSEEGGQKFWGDGEDLKVVLYGMVNKVKSDYRPTDDTVWGRTDGNLKLKYGADLQYHWTPAITAALRFDRLQPNNDVPEQSFAVLSPRIVLQSNWVSREAITFQYSRYIYNQRECAPGVSSPAGFPRARTPGSALCVQPASAAPTPDGFGSNSENQSVDRRGAPTTRPDVNVFKIEATMWW